MTLTILARSAAEPIDPSLVHLIISESVTGQYFNVALLTVLIYHSIITMDNEVKYFWTMEPNPRNMISMIYFANRYIGIVGAISVILVYGFNESLAVCRFSLWTEGVANLITIVLIDYILLIRVLALYHQNKKLAICLQALLTLEASTGLGLLIYFDLIEEPAVGRLAESISVCISVDIANETLPIAVAITSWAIPLAYGLVILILVLYKAAEYWQLSGGFKGCHLVELVVKGQVIYFGLVIFCTVLKIVDISTFDISPFVANLLNAAGSPTLLCVLGGHLLINLKDADKRYVNGGTNSRTESISNIRFE